MNQIRPLGPSTPWRCQPHDNRPPAAWMIPAWAVFPSRARGRIASLHDHSLPTVPHQPCAGHSRARDYTMRPRGRTVSVTSGAESPKLRCEREKEDKKEENLFLCLDAVTTSTLLRPRTGESPNGAGSQLVLPKNAAAPDDERKPSQQPLTMLPKHEKL